MFAHLCFIWSLGHKVIKRDLSFKYWDYSQQKEPLEIVLISQIALQVQRKHPFAISLHRACNRRVWTEKSVLPSSPPPCCPHTHAKMCPQALTAFEAFVCACVPALHCK